MCVYVYVYVYVFGFLYSLGSIKKKTLILTLKVTNL